ncbi:MAG: hypothetical protein ACXVRN_08300, partial [Solirubrobacteraceae bacterium]
LDQESAGVLAFVARRLSVDAIAMLFAVRDPAGRQVTLEGLPELRVSGLPRAEAGQLLASSASGPLDDGVKDQIITLTGGNPLALIELGGGLAPGEPGTGRMASKGLTRAASPWAAKRLRVHTVVPVVVFLPVAAMEAMAISTPAMPTAIRMSPTMSQFTDVPMTRERGSTANRTIAPAAANTNAIPILMIAPLLYSKTRFVLGDSAHDEHGQRHDGEDYKDRDQ